MRHRATRHKVVVIDDHIFIRRGLKASLNIEDDLEVIGEASSAIEALDLCRSLRPAIAIIDQRLGLDNGAKLVSCLRAEAPETRCIVISSFETEEEIYHALQAGAFSYVCKTGPADDLLRAIRAAVKGERFLTPEVTRALAAREARATLSPRELDVLHALAAGASNKEISSGLAISVHTVKQYVASILEKLQVDDRSQAVLEALRRGVIRDIAIR